MTTKQCKDFQLVLQVKSQELISRKPIRRTQKSFSGCYSCKRKKIKCDETKSKCNNCVRCNLECVWPPERKNSKGSVQKVKIKADTPRSSVSSLSFMGDLKTEQIPRKNVVTEVEVPRWRNSETKSPWNIKVSATEKLSHVRAMGIPEIRNTTEVSGAPILPIEPEIHNVSGPHSVSGLPHESDSHNQSQWQHFESSIAHSARRDSATMREQINAGNSLLHLRGSPKQVPSPQIQELDADTSSDNRIKELVLTPPALLGVEFALDSFFFSHFANRFLPTIAQPHFHHSLPQKSLVLSAASHSDMLREIFVACGASLVAFDNDMYREVAQEKYKLALLHFLGKIKHGVVQGGEEWFFVAVQVLQTLCLRDAFGGANATRCAAHFSAAYKIVVLKLLDKPNVNNMGPSYSPLEKVLIENFIFNYSITIFYCDHRKLAHLVPNPFDFFSMANAKLAQMSYEDGSPQSSRMSMLSFQIAAKCSWLCRLKLPLDDADQRLHFEMLLFAETILFSLESVDFTSQEILVQNTVSVAKVVLRSSIILLKKMLDMDSVKAGHLQGLVSEIVSDIGQPFNQDIIFPIWSLMIAASTTLDNGHKQFFKANLEKLVEISKSKIAMQVLNHLEGLWEIYDGDQPFELLFDTEVLDQVCN